ncbi:BCCT family transporter [Salsuginibacillus kocurii]|uniref:BCCT family transporter n=1 Tax=Salsuginibacillus kocurii TaxID=427078 RepID=UPI000380FBBA|nr:BCCT family transporter [Salsuginibacillus kocurii]
MPYRYQSGPTSIVFIVAAIIVIFIAGWGFFFPEHMEGVTSFLLDQVIDLFGWLYVMATSVFLVFCLYLGVGPYRHMKLGKPRDTPEYSFFTWIGMLFAAGMGVGLVFYGVSEPMSHMVNPPGGEEANSQEAAEQGLLYGVFHWGLQPWAIYAIVALALGFAKYRKNLPGLISSAFYPILGDRIYGGYGKGIDLIATIGTTVGIATSFGLSTLQFSGGLEEVFGIENQTSTQLIVVATVTVLFLTSVVTGINRGMRYLSISNLGLMGILMIVVLALGPTLFLLEHLSLTLGQYASSIVQLSFETTPYTDNEWMGEWTFFYWAWVISWSPFVGTFIARVSRGRSVQEFILGVLLVPTLVTVVWFSIFGGTGIYMELMQGAGFAESIAEAPENGLFLVIQSLPLGELLSITTLILILIFFITSANSATFVLGVFSSNGSLNPRNSIMVVWGLLISSIAASLLISGGLDGLQATAILSGLPFTLLMFGMIVSIHKALKAEGEEKHKVEKQEDW